MATAPQRIIEIEPRPRSAEVFISERQLFRNIPNTAHRQAVVAGFEQRAKLAHVRQAYVDAALPGLVSGLRTQSGPVNDVIKKILKQTGPTLNLQLADLLKEAQTHISEKLNPELPKDIKHWHISQFIKNKIRQDFCGHHATPNINYIMGQEALSRTNLNAPSILAVEPYVPDSPWIELLFGPEVIIVVGNWENAVSAPCQIERKNCRPLEKMMNNFLKHALGFEPEKYEKFTQDGYFHRQEALFNPEVCEASFEAQMNLYQKYAKNQTNLAKLTIGLERFLNFAKRQIRGALI